MTTGHDGSLSTIHAGSPPEALRRLETLALMTDLDLPLSAIRDQIPDALDLIVHQTRHPSGHRLITTIAEVVRIAAGPATRPLYTNTNDNPHWHPLSDELTTRLAMG
ncbi:ATPase, T2SS/T4P/T4SS family [Baekduia sp. Peel2402]|uniref:ATPase, T2SS/T4P/T4SS family n=1 Tax=Baekduia sp. Peel2402 TaxID=3458296 RepID=UPI00403E9F9B